MTQTYTIIPGLVSLDTNVSGINDFLLSQNLRFYPPKKQKHHYKVLVLPTFSLPEPTGYRIGNYTISDSVISYRRPLLFGKGFEFSYNYLTKTFTFNAFYAVHNVNIGDIFTIGRHLFHTIEYDLAKENKFILLGAAVAKNNKMIIALAPYHNGKTEFVTEALSRGYSYVSENFLVIDPKNNTAYGTAPIFSNKGRLSNTLLSNHFSSKRSPISPKGTITDIYLSVPPILPGNPNTRIHDYIIANTGYYKKNNFLRSLAYYKLKNIQLDAAYKHLATYVASRTRIVPLLSSIAL